LITLRYSTGVQRSTTTFLKSDTVSVGFGDSEVSFDPPTDVPFQGCGQGNGAGPAIWVAISSILIIMMEAKGFGFECLSAIDSRMVTAQGFAFIDDTDVIEAAKTVDQNKWLKRVR